ncbi:MAG: SDR family NAD(P)-dependent oxidoreductase [Halioglobus sp.]
MAIVTGAASGMGRATAHLFADEGAKVAIFNINEAALETVAEEIRSVGGEVLAIALDLRDRAAIEAAVKTAAAHFNGLDILVNNAGFALPAAIDGDDYEQAIDTVSSNSNKEILAVLLNVYSASGLPFKTKAPNQLSRISKIHAVITILC